MNLVDAEARHAQQAMLEIAREQPEKTLSEVRQLSGRGSGTGVPPVSLFREHGQDAHATFARHLRMPAHHEVRSANVDLKRLGAVLAVAYERDLHDFAELLLLEALGPRTVQSLGWWPRWCMVRRAALMTRRGFRLRTAARTVIHSRCL